MRFIQTIKKGFTLVELLIVIAIIAILSAVVAPNAFKAIEKSKIAAVEADFKAMKTAALSYYADTGQWPKEEYGSKVLVEKPQASDVNGWNGPYMEKWKDNNPWGGKYVYHWGNGLPKKTDKACPYIYVEGKVPDSAAKKLEEDLDGQSSDPDVTGVVRRDSNGVYLIISEQ